MAGEVPKGLARLTIPAGGSRLSVRGDSADGEGTPGTPTGTGVFIPLHGKKTRQRRRRRRQQQQQPLECSSSISGSQLIPQVYQQLARSSAGRQQQGAADRSSNKAAGAHAASKPMSLEQLIALTRSWDLTHGQHASGANSSSSLAAYCEPVWCASPGAIFPETVSSQLSQRLLLLDVLPNSNTSAVAAGGDLDGAAGSAYCGTFSPIGSPRASFRGPYPSPPAAGAAMAAPAPPPSCSSSSDAGPRTAAPTSRPCLSSDLLLHCLRSQSQLGASGSTVEPGAPAPRAATYPTSRSSAALAAARPGGRTQAPGAAAGAADTYPCTATGHAVAGSRSSGKGSSQVAERDMSTSRVALAALGRPAAAAAASATGSSSQEVFGSLPLRTLHGLLPVRPVAGGVQHPSPAAGASSTPLVATSNAAARGCAPLQGTPAVPCTSSGQHVGDRDGASSGSQFCSPQLAAAGGMGAAGRLEGGCPSDLQQMLEEVEAELATSPATPAMVRARHLLRRVAAAAQQQQQQGHWAAAGQGPDVTAMAAAGGSCAAPQWGCGSGLPKDQMLEVLQGVLSSSSAAPGSSTASDVELLQYLLQAPPDAYHLSDTSGWSQLDANPSKSMPVPDRVTAQALSPPGSCTIGTTGPLLLTGSSAPGPHAGNGSLGLLMDAWGLGRSGSSSGSNSGARSVPGTGPFIEIGAQGLAVSHRDPLLHLPEAIQLNQTGSAALATCADVALLEALDLSPPFGAAAWDGPLAAQSIWLDLLQDARQQQQQQQQQQREYTSVAAGGGVSGVWPGNMGGPVPCFDEQAAGPGMLAAVQSPGLSLGMLLNATEQQQLANDPSMLLLCQQLLQGGCGVEGVGAAQLTQQALPAASSSSGATSSSSSSSSKQQQELLLELQSHRDAAGSAAVGAGGGGGTSGCGVMPGHGGCGTSQAMAAMAANAGHKHSLAHHHQQQQILATSKLLASLSVPPV